MWNFTSNYKNILEIFIAIVIYLLPLADCSCGGYIEPTVGQTGYISTHTYYDAYSNCIWLIQAPAGYQVQLDISSFVGQEDNGTCLDSLKIYDGGLSENVILEETCATLTNQNVTSTARWMLVNFKSDGTTITSGLQSIYSTVLATGDISGHKNPIESCNTYQYSCSNKLCLTRSYLCDGQNDCGCDQNCDEQGCEGISLEKLDYMLMSGGIGIGLFVVIFIIVYLIERRRKMNALKEDMEFEKSLKNSLKNDEKKATNAKVAWRS